MGANQILPFASAVVILIYALVVLWRYISRGGAHHLIWGVGLVMYGIGGICEAYYATRGWNDLVFRLWYLFGAMLVAAWLGQGTLHLLVHNWLAPALTAVLALLSIYGAYQIATATLDPSLIPGASLSGHAITSGMARSLTPIFNIYGTVALVGGALYSAWVFWRQRILFWRMVGCILIAAGALAPALGGTLSRFGLTEYLYLGEFLGATIMFIGFLLTIRRAAEVAQAASAR